MQPTTIINLQIYDFNLQCVQEWALGDHLRCTVLMSERITKHNAKPDFVDNILQQQLKLVFTLVAGQHKAET